MNVIFPGNFVRFHVGHKNIIKTLARDFDNVVIVPYASDELPSLISRRNNLNEGLLNMKPYLKNVEVSIGDFTRKDIFVMNAYYKEFDYLACGSDEIETYRYYFPNLVVFTRQNYFIPNDVKPFKIYNMNCDMSSTKLMELEKTDFN